MPLPLPANRKRTFAVRLLNAPVFPCKALNLRTLFPLTAFKNVRNPKFVQNLSQRLFWGVPVKLTEIWKNLSNLSENYRFSNFDTFFQISVPLTGTPQNNRWDKFWTNFGFRAFLKAVRGKRVRNPKSQPILGPSSLR